MLIFIVFLTMKWDFDPKHFNVYQLNNVNIYPLKNKEFLFLVIEENSHELKMYFKAHQWL